jgi:glucose/arabinose dehydrogenase
MKTSARVNLLAGAAAALSLAATSPVQALPVISNGGFESGLTSWTRADQLGSEGTFASQSGTLSPVNGNPVPAPPEGTLAAMTDAQGPGSHVLYQDFTATTGTAALSFSLFIGNSANAFFTPSPASLDFSTPTLNQQARVDILRSTADPFSVAATDVLLNLYQTKVGDPLISGYNTISTDITALLAAHIGETLRLRFAETDNVLAFQLGVDAVRFDQVQIPEPASILLIGAALALLVGWRGRRLLSAHRCATVVAVLGVVISHSASARADTTPLTVLDPNLQVTTVLNAGITQPIGIVFLGVNDFLVLEKASGQIKRVINGVIQPNPVLDLAVNSNSERGLLSMVLHPNFPDVPFAYVRWTESSTGADSGVVSEVPLTGNRLDRFTWDGSTLTFDRNLIMLRSRQTDNVTVPGHPGPTNAAEQGNHNGGVLRFGPDGKLYLFMGDQGRRGLMQNLPNGPFLIPPIVDDNFGGPMPDNAHLSGVILRFNDDGSTPTDNPFFAAGAAMGGEAGANIQKVFSYGHRNGFGMAFDPYSGFLWDTENADDAYSELNRVIPGMNGGWVQLAGPLNRIADWKFIETTMFGSNLQQVRYPPTRAAYTAALAQSRMFMLPGAVYVDPDFSWRFEIGPAGTTFVKGAALGAEYDGTLWMGSARSFQQVGNNGGSLYRFALTTNRLHVDVSADPRLTDRVADNLFGPTKFEGTESETLQIGKGFGTTPSIEQGPDGNLYVVSLTDNAIYKISRRPP